MKSIASLLILSVLCIILSLATRVSACDNACSFASDRNNRCYYTCWENRCNFSGSHHRDEFLNGLQSRGYSCRPEGAVNTLSCAKTNNFGACTSHKWTCGRNC
ncbi:uncharacterized protein BX664DRAFT_348892 [Halteromyces radiatus]|uniref:uncharacterized protein n=1 Tax=Halteromyces radiatus TaxID=101107 RepID=UPI00221FAE00|nr:uncharacterized protein BX664DRAFT_348892 [Halteromyces radiatus]KAI8093695.1 hypothetical protein BX664DRAFT_348892 [Halteromyces radiatus]